MRTNAGTDFQAAVLAQSGAAGAGTGAMRPADFMAVSEDATAPAATDTTLAGELAAFGFTRKAATYAHTAGASSYTLTATFTSSDATTRTLRKVGIFNAAAAGVLAFESLIPTPTPQLSGDALTITETVNL